MTRGSIQFSEVARDQLDLIKPLWNDLKQHHQDRTRYHHDYYQNNTFRKRKAELLAKENLVVLTANKDGEPVSFCVCSITNGVGEVDSLFVCPSQRGLGIASKLMSLGLDWLKDNNASPIRLLVGEGNEEALEFYQKLGFKPRATMMQLG